MTEKVTSFYDALAAQYHLIFEDWGQAIERQARILNPLLSSNSSRHPLKVLDCACGIGTQAIGLASMGHHVVASDLSPAAIARARSEAAARSLEITFQVADMTSLAEIPDHTFDAVTPIDNALPHLTPPQVALALPAIASKLKPGGLFLASIRDYDTLQPLRPTLQPPAFYDTPGRRRIVHQVWDWIDDTRYTVHLYLTIQHQHRWTAHHFVSEYRCLLREELSTALRAAGFTPIRWLMPAESGFYQPLVLATVPA